MQKAKCNTEEHAQDRREQRNVFHPAGSRQRRACLHSAFCILHWSKRLPQRDVQHGAPLPRARNDLAADQG